MLRFCRRIDDGDRLCKDLILLVQERANIEKEFAKQLKAWSTKWNSLIEKGNYQKRGNLNSWFLSVKYSAHKFLKTNVNIQTIQHPSYSDPNYKQWLHFAESHQVCISRVQFLVQLFDDAFVAMMAGQVHVQLECLYQDQASCEWAIS